MRVERGDAVFTRIRAVAAPWLGTVDPTDSVHVDGRIGSVPVSVGTPDWPGLPSP